MRKSCGFRKDRGCMDQVFALTQMCDWYLANWKDVFWAFMDLGRAYDTIDRLGMWQMLRVYGVGWRKIVDSGAEFLCRW